MVQIDAWSLESLESRLESVGITIEGLAHDLGLEPPTIEVEANGLRMESARWRPFWGAMVHVVRNMLDHGVESPQERLAAGKTPQGRIQLMGRLIDGQLVMRFADDGRGIDWEKVVDLATSRGVPCGTAEELSAALFSDGFSTRTEVTEISGRGVGLSAVRAACDALGGRAVVKSVEGEGTEMLFVFPRDLAVRPAEAHFSGQRLAS